MIPDALIVTVNFPSPLDNKDGMGNYVSRVAHALSEETGMNIQVVAFRCGEQEAFERVERLSVRRIDLPFSVSHYDQLYYHPKFQLAVSTLAEGASRVLNEVGHNLPAWCHGYESGSTASKLRERGCPVVGVVHYLIIQDLFHRLETAKDPLRRRHFPLTLSYVLGTVIPKRHHHGLMRMLIRNAPRLCKTRIPGRLELMIKIEQELRLIRSAHRIISVSPGFADTITDFYPDAKGKITHCLAGCPPVGSESNWPFPVRDDRLRLIIVGRPAPQKGWDYAAEALKHIDTDDADDAKRIELVVVGGLGDNWGGDYGDTVIQRLLSLENISFLNMGEIPNKEVQKLMACADALIMPSVFEPFGLVMLEAMAAGCMVVASDCDGPRHVLKQPWGMQIPFKNPTKRTCNLVMGIHSLLCLSREELNKRGESARLSALDYTWNKCARAHARELEFAKAYNTPHAPVVA